LRVTVGGAPESRDSSLVSTNGKLQRAYAESSFAGDSFFF